ncbi:hypothetical protein MYX07_01110 [Patescibacteria group bacterium AH-259-L07]|nr:hypothetical protein [Patescibacteria group bacterium AH-259-L07]
MTKFKYERQGSEFKLERAVNKGAQKIKRLILQHGLRVDPIKDKLDAEARNRKVDSSIILKKALEMLHEEGSFSEKLEKEYIQLIAKEVANTIESEGKLASQAIEEKVAELQKRKKITIDPEQLRQIVEQKTK